jgi:lysophospholipase L1-like esterase
LDKKIKVFIAGDSTAATKLPEKKPETGWGEMIPGYFTEAVEFHNFAVNGRSSKSFIAEGHLQKIEDLIGEGDFLFIEFGHNDEKTDEERHTDPFTTYKEYLTKYIEVARNSAAQPVLLTSIQRRSFDENGIIQDTHGDYLVAMRELAKELNVPLIDMSEKSKPFFEELGPEKTKEIFLWVKPGETPNYPEGVEDNTHFSEKGAKEMARFVVEGILEEQIKPLVNFIKSK